ncbi:MAG: SGNH/GDSL hydrolase family protein [Ruminococcaceae bacterium]|nr:SGNH/GDSL hydrolase family protein [Oscillospiraceae bacterium]
MKKRLLAWILAAMLLAGALQGCGTSNETSGDSTDSVTLDTSTEGTESEHESETEAVTEESIKAGTETMVGTFEDKYGDYIFYRGSLSNTISKLINEKKLTVMYYGGSVTHGAGASDSEKTSWRGLFGDWLKTSFPDAEITNLSAAISGTGSKLGLYRLETDVVPYCPDLIFIEYAINDYYLKDGHEEIRIQNETMIRRLYEMNPKIDIVYLFTENVTTAGSQTVLHAGSKPQNEVAEYYGLNSIALGRALTDTITDKSSASSAEWKTYFQDGVHPIDAGYARYFEVIKEFLIHEVAAYQGEQATDKVLPETTLTTVMKNYVMICGEEMKNAVTGEWSYKRGLGMSSGSIVKYNGYFTVDAATKELSFTFTGKGVSIFFAGSGVQELQYSLDKPSWKSVSSDGNRPLTLLFDNEGEAAEHTLRIRFRAGSRPSDFRIIGFLVWVD